MHFLVPNQNTMNAKITSNINLAKKLKKLGSWQETVLAGVADHLTEEEQTNINFTLNKIDQLSNSIRVEEDKRPNQNTTKKPDFEAFFISFKNDLCAYEESDKMDCLMFSTVDYFRFKTDLYQSFNLLYYQRYITEITYLRSKEIECCYFSPVTAVSSIPKFEKIVYRRILYGKSMSLGKNHHTQQWATTSNFTSLW